MDLTHCAILLSIISSPSLLFHFLSPFFLTPHLSLSLPFPFLSFLSLKSSSLPSSSHHPHLFSPSFPLPKLSSLHYSFSFPSLCTLPLFLYPHCLSLFPSYPFFPPPPLPSPTSLSNFPSCLLPSFTPPPPLLLLVFPPFPHFLLLLPSFSATPFLFSLFQNLFLFPPFFSSFVLTLGHYEMFYAEYFCLQF